MATLIDLTCPLCGGQLDYTPNPDWLVCGRCGNKCLVVGNAPPPAPEWPVQPYYATNTITGLDTMTAELAIRRLRGDIRDLQARLDEVEDGYYAERNQLEARERKLSATPGRYIVLAIFVLLAVMLWFFEFFAWLGNPYDLIISTIVQGMVVTGFLALLMGRPMRWVYRRQIAQIQSDLQILESTYLQASQSYEANLKRKQAQLEHHLNVVGDV